MVRIMMNKLNDCCERARSFSGLFFISSMVGASANGFGIKVDNSCSDFCNSALMYFISWKLSMPLSAANSVAGGQHFSNPTSI